MPVQVQHDPLTLRVGSAVLDALLEGLPVTVTGIDGGRAVLVLAESARIVQVDPAG